jgi:ribose 5-phosphate isomerase A
MGLRQGPAGPFLTDEGHYIVDCATGAIDDPEELAAAISGIPGVVEHGLFIGIATGAVIARADGALTLLGDAQTGAGPAEASA